MPNNVSSSSTGPYWRANAPEPGLRSVTYSSRIHAADEGVKALVDPRQRQVHLEAKARLEAVELVVEQRGRDRTRWFA